MGQKVHPIGFRLSLDPDLCDSRWFGNKKQEYSEYVLEDYVIRKLITEKLQHASVERIVIERSGNRLRVTILTARPGIVIGRKGQELDKLKAEIQKLTKRDVILDIQDVKYPDLVATIVAQNVALQLERRVAFRRAMKKAVMTTMSLPAAKGILIQVSGRLGGTDIARTEKQREGSVPRQTLRAKISYGFVEARTLYGIIGVKCWIYILQPERK